MNKQLTVKWFLITLLAYAIFSAWLAAMTWRMGTEIGCMRAVIDMTGGKFDFDAAKTYCDGVRAGQ